MSPCESALTHMANWLLQFNISHLESIELTKAVGMDNAAKSWMPQKKGICNWWVACETTQVKE